MANYSFWILIFVAAIYMQQNQYPTLVDPNYSFFAWGVTIAFAIPILFYKKIVNWLTPLPFQLNSQVEKIMYRPPYIVIPFAVLCYSFVVGAYLSNTISYFNQYNVSSPIKIIKTRITVTEHHIGGYGYGRSFVLFEAFNQIQKIRDNNLYDLLLPNDQVILKIQEGRFGKYFVKEIVWNNSLNQYKFYNDV